MSNFESMKERIEAATTTAALYRLETSFDRLINMCIFTPAETVALDNLITDKLNEIEGN